MRISWMVAFVIGFLTVAIDLYIYFDLRKNFAKKHRWAPTAYAISAIVMWIAAAVMLCMPYRSGEMNIQGLMWALYTYITIYASKIVFVIFSLIGLLPYLWRHGRKRRSWRLGQWIGLPLSLVTFFVMWYGVFVTRHQIEVTHVNIVSGKIPKGFDGFRIVQISDLHTGTWGDDTRFISKLADSVNNCKPDVVFFTGDIVNRQTSELTPFLKTLSKIKAPYGVYSILGNHDYGDYMVWESDEEKASNLELMKAWQAQIGWKMLNNRRVPLIAKGDTIQLIGVENWGEPPFRQYGHLLDAYPISKDSVYNLNDNRYKILLTHNPEHWRREASQISNINLTLSGHTHAMQMIFGAGRFRWSPSALMYETWGGLYERTNQRGDNLKIYVNIGAGEVGMPYRIGGAVPEVTVITLHRPGNKNVKATKAYQLKTL